MRAGRRGQCQNWHTMCSIGRTLEKVYLSADSAVLLCADRFGADLASQIHLQGTIDGHHPVKLTDILDIVGVADRTQLNYGIIIQKVQQAARPDRKAGDDLATIDLFTSAGNDSPLHEVDHPIGNHFAVDAQVTTVA